MTKESCDSDDFSLTIIVSVLATTLVSCSKDPLLRSVSTRRRRSSGCVVRRLVWVKKMRKVFISSKFWLNPCHVLQRVSCCVIFFKLCGLRFQIIALIFCLGRVSTKWRNKTQAFYTKKKLDAKDIRNVDRKCERESPPSKSLTGWYCDKEKNSSVGQYNGIGRERNLGHTGFSCKCNR